MFANAFFTSAPAPFFRCQPSAAASATGSRSNSTRLLGFAVERAALLRPDAGELAVLHLQQHEAGGDARRGPRAGPTVGGEVLDRGERLGEAARVIAFGPWSATSWLTACWNGDRRLPRLGAEGIGLVGRRRPRGRRSPPGWCRLPRTGGTASTRRRSRPTTTLTDEVLRVAGQRAVEHDAVHVDALGLRFLHHAGHRHVVGAVVHVVAAVLQELHLRACTPTARHGPTRTRSHRR